MTFAFDVLRERHAVAATGGAGCGGARGIAIDGVALRARLIETDGAAPGGLILELEGDGNDGGGGAATLREPVWIARDGDRLFVHLRGRAFEVRALDPLTLARGDARARRGEELLTAPMPGVVVEVHVAPGDEVAAGQTLLVIESMKLQTVIAAEVAGRVTELPVARGEGFEQGAVLARIEAESETRR